jgi:cobalamin biosynthesis protein CobT
MEPACMMQESDGNDADEDDDADDSDADSDEDDEDDEDSDGNDDNDEDATNGDVKIINMSIGDIIDIIETQSNESESDEALVELDVTEPVPSVHKIMVTDYKKMTVAELKQIVSSQNLATNASKLTKTELLKLLEK